MRFRVEPERFTLLGMESAPGTAELLALSHPPAQLVVEADETSLLLREAAAEKLLEAHPGARAERALRWIRFETPMDLELVGFLAAVSARLAAAGVPIGAVCGYSRDHLFVSERHLPRALEVLHELFPAGGDGA